MQNSYQVLVKEETWMEESNGNRGQSREDDVNYRGLCLNWLYGLSTLILILKKVDRSNVCGNEFSNLKK